MKAVMLAHDQLIAGSATAGMLAGGMESMSNAPHLLPKARQGYRYGHVQVLDHMVYDGLEDAYEHKAMGVYAEATAEKYGFTRAQQDAFALESVRRAQLAVANGSFKSEIAPVAVKAKGDGTLYIDTDETPGQCKI